ncbi:hypothetical protein ABZ816_35130 [Actinosynnema sp. NPDC047251]|uniref:Uncharacterized protein n=1 Tax=Saccharothrix espanaensis (strain ATCC 51144 / DSM 44229 / JCM 9112 / NBRC 15066 / NRRL 15764) TaxID=1179773 RepID=K0JWL5_SACES|nr:hypothetical protein [Saccharothrix espanaensis]CCH28563.1 hypothetical protein BN6_12370 [Saccharothrix espanaensis DSM 44229]
MALQDLPVMLSGYRLMITEAPVAKVREADDGTVTPVVDRVSGAVQYVVTLFAKPVPVEGRKVGKGEEIRVNLPGDPGKGFEEGTYVELVNAVVNTYEIPDRIDPRKIASAGLWFKAAGLKSVTRSARSAA